MKKNYFILKKIIYCFILFSSFTVLSQTLNFTIDSAFDTGTSITETIVDSGDTYILNIDHVQNVEELDDLGGGDLVFYLGSGSSSTPFFLTITKDGTPINFNLNNIDYDTLGAGTISVTNQDDEAISSPTFYPLGSGSLAITNPANAQNISEIKINPGDINDLNDFGFHNITVEILETLSLNKLLSLDNYVSIFPNPSNGDITIKNSGIPVDRAIISDVNGRSIVSYNLNGIAANKELNLSSVLSSGMYFITISAENQSVVKKIIIE